MLGYTDASSEGIAFVSGNKWQRWRWNQLSDQLLRSLRSHTNEIDCNWAELVAVYAAVYICAEEGYQRIVLRSDNMAVVEMFQRHVDVHPSLWGTQTRAKKQFRDLLTKVGGLMAKHRLDVVIEWISGIANPADGPSRGKKLSEETRLSYGASVPEDLVGVLVGA